MPFIEVNIENNNSAGVKSCQYKPLIGRQGYTSNCAVCLLKLEFHVIKEKIGALGFMASK